MACLRGRFSIPWHPLLFFTPLPCCIMQTMKTVAAILLLMMLAAPLCAALFPGYEFSFIETAGNTSLKSSFSNGDIGLDYTGFGFVGSDTTTGIYLRIGLQAPYRSLLSLFTGQKDPDPMKTETHLRRTFLFAGAIGPAMRSSISEGVTWYMGIGASIIARYSDRIYSSADYSHNRLEMNLGWCFDTGLRFHIRRNMSFNIGLLASSVVISLDISRNLGSGEESIEMIPYLFTMKDKTGENLFNACCYISLGHTFGPKRDVPEKRYIITTSESFTGILVESQDQDL